MEVKCIGSQVRSHMVFLRGPLIWSEFPESQREKGNKISSSGLTVISKRMKSLLRGELNSSVEGVFHFNSKGNFILKVSSGETLRNVLDQLNVSQP